MHRLQYMNHGTEFETLAGNFVVDVSGTDRRRHPLVRVAPDRRRGGLLGRCTRRAPTPSTTTTAGWAASAMDQSGNIALAYNVSSSSTYPSLRYTGRTSDDPLGVMTADGDERSPPAPARAGRNRYGDYAAMGLDPADDCTFWFTGEYNLSTTWTTRWASFKFDQCGCLLEPTPPVAPGDLRRGQPDRPDLERRGPGDGHRLRGAALAHAGRPVRDDRGDRRQQPRFRRRSGIRLRRTPTSAGASRTTTSSSPPTAAPASPTRRTRSTVTPDGLCRCGRCSTGSAAPGPRSARLAGTCSAGTRRRRSAATQALYNIYRSTDPGLRAGAGQPGRQRHRRHRRAGPERPGRRRRNTSTSCARSTAPTSARTSTRSRLGRRRRQRRPGDPVLGGLRGRRTRSTTGR